jgi:two-component SAPR family response regulator
MKILALDDSESALKLLVSAVTEAQPSAEVFAFSKPSELLVFAEENTCCIAFLDIEIWDMSGLAVAKALKNINQRTNIIFVTAFSKYASEAFELYPSGYILKPVTVEAVDREIKNLRHPVVLKCDARIYAQSFGNFEVYSYGVPLKFSYSKTKELLAYLIDRNGAFVTNNELCAVLWEDKQDSSNLKSYLRKLISDLTMVLNKADADNIILKHRGSIAIVPEKITCDYYEFRKYDPQYVNAYFGQYMAQYSWAEMTTCLLNDINK